MDQILKQISQSMAALALAVMVAVMPNSMATAGDMTPTMGEDGIFTHGWGHIPCCCH